MKIWNDKILPFYSLSVRNCLNQRYLVVSIAFVFSVVSVIFAIKFIPFQLFPGAEDANFRLKIEAKVGTPIEKTEEIVVKIENITKTVVGDQMESQIATIGQHVEGGPSSEGSDSQGSQYAQITTHVKPSRNVAKEIPKYIETVTKELAKMKEIQTFSFSQGRSGPPVGKAVSVQVIGENYDHLKEVAGKVKSELGQINGVRDIEDTIETGKEELIVRIDEKRLSLANLSRAEVSSAVRATFDGIIVDNIQKLDEEIDIRVTLPQIKKESLSTLTSIRVPSPSGNLVPLGHVANLEKKTTAGAFRHYQGLRSIGVEAEVTTETITSRKANAIMKKKIVDLEREYPEIEFLFEGEESDTLESFRDLGRTFVFAVLGILLLLMLQFNNLYQPIIIACIVPLGLISVIWAFFFHQVPLSFLAVIGMIALAGVIVNNAIVFIDFSNNEKKQGTPIRASILAAAQARLRPIFLTTVTTVAGIMPTAYGIGGKDDFVVPIALSLGWGMLFGSILTTLVLPCLIYIADDIRTKAVGIFFSKKNK